MEIFIEALPININLDYEIIQEFQYLKAPYYCQLA